MATQTTLTISGFTPHPDKVFVTDLEAGVRKTAAGLILPDDDMKDSGIRNRWGRVWSVGTNVTELKVGDWVLVEHGRWSVGMDIETPEDGAIRIWHIDYPDHVLVACDKDPREHQSHTL